MTPEDVLKADASEVKLWCALLDGFEAGEFSADIYWGRKANQSGCWKLPFYTTSLDAIWPLQKQAMGMGPTEDHRGYRYWLKRTMTPNDTNLIHKYIVADALARAKAVCLCRLPDLTSLLEEV